MKTFNRVGLAVTALATIVLLGACSSDPEPSSPGATPSATPAAPSATPTPAVSPTPDETPTTQPALGWPRDGWTMRTGLAEGLNGVAIYFPNSWTFDNNESGTWWDGTYHVFCDAYVDHTLNNPGAPDVQTIATTQWSLMGATVTNQHAISTYYGYEGWGGDYGLPLLPGTVEHRAYVLIGNVWIHCGAITRNTAASGDELWDIVDSIQTPPPETPLPQKAWNSN